MAASVADAAFSTDLLSPDKHKQLLHQLNDSTRDHGLLLDGFIGNIWPVKI
jgi:hypothetical protein